jgi:hypothetical protein
MPRLTLSELPMPARAYRIDLVPGYEFETLADTQKEDAKRRRRLLSHHGRPTAEKEARDVLAERLLCTKEEAPKSLASAVGMRDLRRRLIGGLLPLCEDGPGYHATLMPRGCAVTPDGLKDVDPKNEAQWLRMALRRCGVTAETQGWIYGYLEGEYNPATGMIQLHWHLIICGEAMRQAVERLRGHSRFRRVVGGANNPDGIDVRIEVKRLWQAALPLVIGYTTKVAWFSKWRTIDTDGRPKSQRQKCRIPEPVHSQVLLWLDQWTVGDMALLVNLHVTKKGLTPR